MTFSINYKIITETVRSQHRFKAMTLNVKLSRPLVLQGNSGSYAYSLLQLPLYLKYGRITSNKM